MRKTRLLSKKIWMLMAILFLGVVSTQAAAITYSLTTKVDGRTITGTANLSEGANLQSNMPQDLWRGYTTYKFYSDQDLTVEITTAPAEDATVYVDYEFDPPFLMSSEDSDPVWNYLRNYNGGGSSQRYVYYENNRIYSRAHTTNAHMKADYTAHWAFYGDGYSFHVKNRSVETNPWLIWGGTSNRLQLGAKQSVGWQLYANAATNSHRPGGTVSFGIPETTSLAYLDDIGLPLTTRNITSEHKFDDHNQLVAVHPGSSSQATQEKNALWWYAFFASPITSFSTTEDIWHVTYKIRKADGTWYDDIVVQKSTSNLAPSFPPAGFTRVEGCEYERFYNDPQFTDKWPDGENMPNDRNTTLFIKEVKYVSTPWMTLVLPFPISSPASYFGENATISINEYEGVESHLSSNGESFSCKLFFSLKNEIEAYKPYLFKAKNVDEALLNWSLRIYGDIDETQLIPIDKTDNTNAAGIKVSMIGVLNPDGYSMPADGLKFFFGSKDNGEGNYTYKFVIPNSAVTIPQFRCYFYVTDERSNASTFALDFDDIELTGICQTTFSTVTNSPIYNINGQKMSATKTSDLPKGLYIVNGKKIIVK